MPRDIDLFWTSLDTIKDRVAAPYAILRIDDIKPFIGCLVTGIERESVRLQERSRAEVVFIRPEGRA